MAIREKGRRCNGITTSRAQQKKLATRKGKILSKLEKRPGMKEGDQLKKVASGELGFQNGCKPQPDRRGQERKPEKRGEDGGRRGLLAMEEEEGFRTRTTSGRSDRWKEKISVGDA